MFRATLRGMDLTMKPMVGNAAQSIAPCHGGDSGVEIQDLGKAGRNGGIVEDLIDPFGAVFRDIKT